MDVHHPHLYIYLEFGASAKKEGISFFFFLGEIFKLTQKEGSNDTHREKDL